MIFNVIVLLFRKQAQRSHTNSESYSCDLNQVLSAILLSTTHTTRYTTKNMNDLKANTLDS